MSTGFALGNLHTVNRFSVTVLSLPLFSTSASNEILREAMNLIYISSMKYLLIRSRSVEASCTILTSQVCSSESCTLVNIVATGRTFPILRTLTSERFKHVEAGSTILTRVTFAVVTRQPLCEVCHFHLQICDASIEIVKSCSISRSIRKRRVSRYSTFNPLQAIQNPILTSHHASEFCNLSNKRCNRFST